MTSPIEERDRKKMRTGDEIILRSNLANCVSASPDFVQNDELSSNSLNESRNNDNHDGNNWINSIIQILPFDQVRKFIFGKLGLESKKNCRLVCKLWEERVSEVVYFDPTLNDTTAEALIKSTKPISELSVCGLQNFQYPEGGIGFHSVERIVLMHQVSSPGHEQMIEGKISGKNLQKLFEECKDVRWLEVRGKAVQETTDFSFLKDVVLNKLQRLKLDGGRLDLLDFGTQILQNTFPHLRDLEIDFHLFDKNGESYIDSFYTQIFEFIARHRSTLKEIIINREDVVEDEGSGVEVQLYDMDANIENEITEQLQQVQLSKLQYTATSADELYPFGNELLKAQMKLTSIYLFNVDIGQTLTELWNLLPQVLQQCSETLKYFTFIGCCYDGASFPCTILASCNKLESLFLTGSGQLSDIEYLPKQIKFFEILGEYTLTANQIDFIATQMHNLEFLNLSGEDNETNRMERINLLIFKKLMKMPRLKKLKIKRTSIGLTETEINTWIAIYGQGCIRIEDCQVDPSQFWIIINRRNFDSNQVVL